MTPSLRPESADGRRRLTPEHRARLAESARERFASLDPAAKAAQVERLRHRRPAAPADLPPADVPPAPAPDPEEGRRSPLDDAPGAAAGPARPVGARGAPPIFRIPELPEPDPTAPGAPDLGPDLVEPAAAGIAVTPAQIETLLRFPFELVAIRRGPHWKLRVDEAAMVAEPLARKVNENQLAARAIGAGGDWAVIVGGLAVLVSARVAEDNKRAAAAADRAGGPDGSGQGRVPSGDGGRPRRGDREQDARGSRLNGFHVVGRGADDAPRPDALDPEAPGWGPVQAL